MMMMMMMMNIIHILTYVSEQGIKFFFKRDKDWACQDFLTF